MCRGRGTRTRAVVVELVTAKMEVGAVLYVVAVMMLLAEAWSHDVWFYCIFMYNCSGVGCGISGNIVCMF